MNEKHLNIGIIGASPVSGNKGCEALLYSNLWIIDEIAAECNVKINIFILNGYSASGEFSFPFGSRNIRATLLPELSFFSKSSIVYTFLNLGRINSYRNLDVVLSIGCGDSFSDIYGKERFDSVNAPIRFMQRLGCKVVVLPQTIGPFNSTDVEKKARRTLEACTCIMTRDYQSSCCVGELLPGRECQELTDAAFFMPFERDSFPAEKVHVGLGISNLLWRGGYTGKNEFCLQCDYQELMGRVLNLFLANDQVALHLVPHTVSGSEFQEDDYSLALKIQKEYGRDKIVVAPFFKNPILAKNYIAGMDFFLGSRMHACIAAFSSGVPVFPMAYSRKFNGLFADSLGYPYMSDLTAQLPDDTINAIRDGFARREELRSLIAGKLNDEIAEYRRRYKEILKQQFRLI